MDTEEAGKVYPFATPLKKMTSLHEQEQSLLPSSLSLSPRSSSSSARRGCGGCILSSTDFAGSRWGLLLLRALPFTAAVTFLCACYGAMGERGEEREERETTEREREGAREGGRERERWSERSTHTQRAKTRDGRHETADREKEHGERDKVIERARAREREDRRGRERQTRDIEHNTCTFPWEAPGTSRQVSNIPPTSLLK